MAIYNRWGDKVTIVANLGEHQPEGFVTPVTLVKVKFEDFSHSFIFIIFLKADNGWKEVQDAVDKAPSVKLHSKQLEAAIGRAL